MAGAVVRRRVALLCFGRQNAWSTIVAVRSSWGPVTGEEATYVLLPMEVVLLIRNANHHLLPIHTSAGAEINNRDS